MQRFWWLCCLGLLLGLQDVSSLRHRLIVKHDDRRIFKIETFGAQEGAVLSLRVNHFTLRSVGGNRANHRPVASPVTTPSNHTVVVTPSNHTAVVTPSNQNHTTATPHNTRQLLNPIMAHGGGNHEVNSKNSTQRVGFVLRHARSEASAQKDLERFVETGECIFDHLTPLDGLLDISDPATWGSKALNWNVDTSEKVGLYSLVFARCHFHGLHYSAFHLNADFVNPGPSYLSAGDAPLPKIFGSLSAIHAILFVLWCLLLWTSNKVSSSGNTTEARGLLRIPSRGGSWWKMMSVTGTSTVGRMHYMMAALLLLKSLATLCEAARYHDLSLTGHTSGWTIGWYVFGALKGMMLFSVLLLIGTGYSVAKNFLSPGEKRVVGIVLCLQVLANIASIIIEETAPGSKQWLVWRDVLHVVDIMCCLAILLPIVWSIRHLRQASEADGKAHSNLDRLRRLRSFYIAVVIYIYVTRIGVYILANAVTYEDRWIAPFSAEVATLIFFLYAGWQFRPGMDGKSGNDGYLSVAHEDRLEFGLPTDEDDDDAIELIATQHHPSMLNSNTA